MERSVLSRRSLLKAAIYSLCAPDTISFAGSTVAGTRQTEDPNHVSATPSGRLYISGARQSSEEYAAVVFDEHGTILSSVPLSARAHGAACHHQTNRACLFARRPGLYMNTFDLRAPQTHHSIAPMKGRHYYGHGAFSSTGDLLFATENDYEAARGVIGLYDATRGYQRIGETSTAGVGPHEVVRVPGSSLLVLANGGIQTHPDSGRDKLNIDSMHPSLSIIDSRDGTLVGQHFLSDDLHQVSLRHLACTGDGEVWFAGQYEGTDPTTDGLAGFISIEQSIDSFQRGVSRKGLTLIDLPAGLQMQSLRYLSSVAVAGNQVIYTAAKGGLAFSINRKTRQLKESVSLFDASGVAALPYTNLSANAEKRVPDGSTLITTGTGEIVRLGYNGATRVATHRLQWDNHLYALF